MSERMLRAGAPERPKEGIYLDATLAVIGEQLDERIDELSRRRRARARVGVGALSVFAVASGSVAAAYAFSAPSPAPEPAPVAVSTTHELRCVEFEAAGHAYFSLRYRSPEDEPAADGPRVCAGAWSALEADRAALLAATPDEIVAVAEGLVAEARPRSAVGAARAVDVTDASFGRISRTGAPPPMVECAAGEPSVVLSEPAGGLTPTEQALACVRAAS